MSAAANLAGFVSFEVRSSDNLRFQGKHFRSGQNDAVEFQLQPSLANEMTGVLGFLEVAAQHRAARKQRVSERCNWAKMAQHRITGLCRFRREIRFVHRAMQKRSG